jgi:hypothetical protein
LSDITLFRAAFVDLLRPKKLITALILVAIAALLGLLLREKGDNFDAEITYNALSAGLLFGFLLVILSVVFSTGVLTAEIEQKTIVYLLTRPVPRWRILLMKFLAAVAVTTLTAWTACLLLGAVLFGFGGSETRATLFTREDLRDIKAFAKRVEEQKSPLDAYLSANVMAANLLASAPEESDSPQAQMALTVAQSEMLKQLNEQIKIDASLYAPERTVGVTLSPETRRLAEQHPQSGSALSRLNRSFLADAYPETFAPPRTPTAILLRDILILPLGALAYGSLFLFLATLLNRPLMYGLLFAFGWESWVPNLPGDFQKVSLMSYLRVLAPHPSPEVPSEGLAGLLTAFNPQTIAPGLAWTVLPLFTLTMLGAALFLFSTQEYVPREDAE